MDKNPFQILSEDIEGDQGNPTMPDQRPSTPIGLVAPAPPMTPRKKIKAKRKANSPIPAVTPIKMAEISKKDQKSAPQHLYTAKLAMQAAVRAQQRDQGERYTSNEDIILIISKLEGLLAKESPEKYLARPEDLEIQDQLAKINKKLDSLIEATKTPTQPDASIPALMGVEGNIRQKFTFRPPPQAIPRVEKPKSFADALRAPIHQTITPQASPKVTTYRERRLILQGTAEKGQNIDSMGLRDQINKAFREKAQILTPVVGTVTKSQKGEDIVLSTTEKFDADFLRKNEAIWKPFFAFNRAIKDTIWGKVVIHSIPTEIFNVDGGMKLLEEEIKVYNGLNPISQPRWLSSKENRDQKMHGSVVVYFESKAEAEKALRNRLQIAGISARTTEYIPPKPKPTKPIAYQGLSSDGRRMEQFSHIQL
jgi:hypothetical protein